MSKNFKYLDDLIHSGVKEIVLDFDIVLDDGEESEYEGGISLDVNDLVIDGNGHTIDAQEKAIIFHCTGKNITIKNSILKNGFAEKYCGAIENCGELTIIESTLTENTANIGGAIYNDGELTITESTLTENTAQDGGAIYNYKGEITITESTLIENTADRGGAIYNFSELTITESTLIENTAQDGGAIYNKGELTITESTLIENTAQVTIFGGGMGGAIYNDEYPVLTITESTLIENTAQDGGAIYNERSFKIFDCEFSGNKSPNNIILNYRHLQIHNTIFNNNQSKFIVLNDGDGANLGIFYGEFRENNVEESVLCNSGKFCGVEKTVFQDNISKNTLNIINESELTLTNPKIKDKGKSILNQNFILIRKSPPELENIIDGDGAVEVDEKIIPQGESFDFGYLDKKIHESNTKEIILDQDITFENYERDFYEGGIELDRNDLIINGNGHTIDGADKSRIFIITGKNITLKNIIFKNGHSHKNHDNPLNNNGGAIKINHNGNITIENCEFINNTSEWNGGAIHNFNGELMMTESTLTGNTSDGFGGAIYNFNGGLMMTESTLTENTAEFGGAIDNQWGELTITESTLTGNTADIGGAISNRGELTITESTLTGNTAKYSGGAISNDGELTITESTLTGNTAQETISTGGAIYNKGDELTIHNSTLNDNTANRCGGAIYLEKSKKYESDNCTFKNNKPDDVYESKY